MQDLPQIFPAHAGVVHLRVGLKFISARQGPNNNRIESRVADQPCGDFQSIFMITGKRDPDPIAPRDAPHSKAP
jgi:hypothetical protein